MDFFFPDSQDQVDPSFDFEGETSSRDRVRQRDDRYAHEVISPAPYDGLLLSKALVDGPGSKYTFAQRQRLYRLGLRRFFRLDQNDRRRLKTLGDCGAFNYVREEEPPYTVEDVFDFYDECGFDYGVSLDHLILGFVPDVSDTVKTLRPVDPAWRDRQELTLTYAAEFFRLHRVRRPQFQPLGVAQGWSPASYAQSVAVLQRMGYRYIALGGMVPLKTPEILSSLRAVADVRLPDTRFHLLGISRTDAVNEFRRFGVVSLDSTSPFRQAFKDDKDNYYARTRTYVAVRVPQIDANNRVKKRILAGELDQNLGRDLERRCLEALAAYGRRKGSLDATLDALRRYDDFLAEPGKARVDKTALYRETLAARPWEKCKCAICKDAKIQVVVFRGTERNKRRGFHNLFVFNNLLHEELALAS